MQDGAYEVRQIDTCTGETVALGEAIASKGVLPMSDVTITTDLAIIVRRK
jgi:hypothetical protein